MSALGLSSIATQEEFARAVGEWQKLQGNKDNDIDGIVGPNTWKRLQQVMKSTASAPVSPSQTSPSAVKSADKNFNELAIEIYEAE